MKQNRYQQSLSERRLSLLESIAVAADEISRIDIELRKPQPGAQL
jgi:hypothetical protein